MSYAFDKIHVLLDLMNDKNDQPIFKENELFDFVASNSDTAKDQCIKIINALIDILNNKIDIYKTAKKKFTIGYKLTNFVKYSADRLYLFIT